MELKEAIENALDNDAILFLGAGASVGATNLNSTEFKVGTGLIHLLCSEIEIKDSKNLQLAVEHYMDAKNDAGLDGEQELIDLLRKEFTAKTITDYQKLFPSIPWKRIYTTNYDDIIEKSYSFEGKNISTYTLNERRRDGGDIEYIHINGSIKKLDKNTLNNQFKLTDVSYITASFESDYWGKLFIQDLKTYSSIIFLGFSLENDLDLKRLIYCSTLYQDKCVFIVYEKEDDENIKLMSKYGAVYKIGCEGFFDEVLKIRQNYEPKKNATLDNTVFTNFECRRSDNNSFAELPSDRAVYNYYTTGKRVSDLYFPVSSGYSAVVKRTYVDRMLNDIEQKNIDVVFLHSDIGNGKSEIVEQIAISAPKKYNIFILKDNNEKIHKEIEIICNAKQKSIIIIENFFNYDEVFDLFKINKTKNNIHFILISRTSIYKNRYETFAEELSTSTYDANRLDDNEINELLRIFENYGYYLNKNHDNKTVIIKDCGKKMQAIMLKFFEHTGITEELLKVIKDINDNQIKEQYVDFIIYMLLIKIMAFDIDFYEIVQLCSDQVIDYNFEKNPYINEFVDFGEKKAKIKSTALAVWLINQLTIKNKIFYLLSKIVKRANESYQSNKKLEGFLRNVVSFKHLKFLLDTLTMALEDKYNLINDFYESIKNLEYYKDKYFFWLQYGIAALEMGDVNMAEMHFKAAYAKCFDGMKPFEIDNQNARLKIERLLLSDVSYSEKTIIEIEEINKLLTPSLAPADDEYYCYKMAYSYYRKLFIKFYSCMKESEQNRLKSFAKQNFALCKRFRERSRNRDFVSKLLIFEREFLGLSVYSDDTHNQLKGKISYLLTHFIKIEFVKEGKPAQGQIRLSNAKSQGFNTGDMVEFIVKNYNKKQNCWELELIE